MSEEVNSSPFYKDRADWADVTPIPMSEEEKGVVRIHADEAFLDAFAFLRAVLQSKEMSSRCFELTSDCIQLNPANYTVWQYRRDLLQALHRDLVVELHYISDIILENPKNYQVWHHRRCLIDWMGNPGSEIAFTTTVLEDEPKNYHAWQHRQWVVRRFGLAGQNEIDFATKLILEDPRNNSAWNYRYFIHQSLNDLDKKEVLDVEINLCKQLAGKMPHNESVWNYLAGLLISCGLTSRQDVVDWAENLYAENDLSQRAHYLVSFVLDIVMEKIEKQGGVENVDRAKQLCDELTEIDPVRTNYWKYQKLTAENSYERYMTSSKQF